MGKSKILASFLIASLVSFFEMVQAQTTANGPNITTISEVSVEGKKLFVPCTGETISMEGYMIIITSIQSSGRHMNMHVLYDPRGVTGASSNGHQYMGGTNIQQHYAGNANGQFIAIGINDITLLGLERSADLKAHIFLLLTINGNEVETANVSFVAADCQ